MDEQRFQTFLKRGGRSPAAVDRCIRCVREYSQYLQKQYDGMHPDGAGHEELLGFVTWLEQRPKTSAKTHLWAIRYYYEYTSNVDMRSLAGILRQQRIKRKSFALKDFRGAPLEHVEKLAAAGIKNVEQMRQAGRTPGDRTELSIRSGVPLAGILEMVKLSDLARIPGVKGIRARLYYDAGVDTPEEMARWDPEELRAMLLEFVERTGFDGIAPLPKEAAFSVATAAQLPPVIEY